ncbi:MAG: hypothetical protein KC609_25870, partial [Myxococcales bacterium]|nr:hypothetical protein [Myxococcales bacterium]
EALNPDGVYLCLEINCSDRLQEMAGPIGTVMFGISLMYCMTTSLAQGGAGLGTAGLHETKMSELADAAGFTHVRRIDLNNPFNVLYELHP